MVSSGSIGSNGFQWFEDLFNTQTPCVSSEARSWGYRDEQDMFPSPPRAQGPRLGGKNVWLRLLGCEMGHIIHNLYVTTRGPLQSQEDRSLTQALHSSGCHALEGVYPSFCQGLEGQRETPRIPKYRMPHPRMLD